MGPDGNCSPSPPSLAMGKSLRWPSPTLPRLFQGGLSPLKVTFTVRLGVCHQLTNLCVCELTSTSSVQQYYRKMKSQTNCMIAFWTTVFSLDKDDVNSVSGDVLVHWLAHTILSSHILFLLLEKTCNHNLLMMLGTASRKAS